GWSPTPCPGPCWTTAAPPTTRRPGTGVVRRRAFTCQVAAGRQVDAELPRPTTSAPGMSPADSPAAGAPPPTPNSTTSSPAPTAARPARRTCAPAADTTTGSSTTPGGASKPTPTADSPGSPPPGTATTPHPTTTAPNPHHRPLRTDQESP